MSRVFFTNLRTRPNQGLLQKLEALVLAAGLDDLPLKGSLVALKVHFGEPGNLAFLRPNYVAAVARLVKERGASPSLPTPTPSTGGGVPRRRTTWPRRRRTASPSSPWDARW